MSAIHDSITELIFNTPLVRAPHYLKAAGAPDADIALKLEYFNPAGSVKDRIALAMITDAEKRGVLKPGGTIIEPSSGNTGIGLAAVGTARGYKVKVVLPASLSVERRALIQAYGGEVILTPGPLAIKGSIAYAKQLHDADPSSVILGQFDNPANPEIHYKTTGPEIWKDTDGTVDVFIAGIGTGGTLSGAGKYLEEQKPDLKVIGIEPPRARSSRVASPARTESRALAPASSPTRLTVRSTTRLWASPTRTPSPRPACSAPPRASSWASAPALP